MATSLEAFAQYIRDVRDVGSVMYVNTLPPLHTSFFVLHQNLLREYLA